jgi:hypothetical protein
MFGILKRPGEKKRRKVLIAVWAEALRNKDILAIVRRGIAQGTPVTGKFRDAQTSGAIPKGMKPEALTRVMLALFQGFVLQQAWEPEVSVDEYLDGVLLLIDAAFGPRALRMPA